MNAPYPEGDEVAYLALGCFWGAERKFFETPGVYVTAVGYQGGFTPNPTYEEVCTGRTGHAEVVKVAYNPSEVSFGELLRVFYENHDPTQGFRQGGDVGTQYRSAIFYVNDEQLAIAKSVIASFAERLSAAGFGPITTEISAAGAFIWPRSITSSTSSRIRTVTAVLVELGSLAPSAFSKASLAERWWPRPHASCRERCRRLEVLR